jgi:hypothetical protein
MVKVVERYEWDVEVSNVYIKVSVRLINDVLDLIEIAYCTGVCNFMTVTAEHPSEYQDMVLNFASLVTAFGELKREEYSMRIDYTE